MSERPGEDTGDVPPSQSFIDRFTWRPGDVEVLTKEQATAALGFDPDPAETALAEGFLCVLGERTADCLSKSATEAGLTRVTEARHMQPCCAKHAKALATESDPPPDVKAEAALKFEDWPGLGGIDVYLVWPGNHRVALELKCGGAKDSLGPCVWDLAKCAFLLAKGRVTAAYLAAATTSSLWDQRVLGAELFESDTWRTDDLRARYLSWWKKWELEKYRPTVLPAEIRTEGVMRQAFAVGSTSWELRLVRVRTGAHQWRPWQSVLAESL
jgi:hypothetical protein